MAITSKESLVISQQEQADDEAFRQQAARTPTITITDRHDEMMEMLAEDWDLHKDMDYDNEANN